LRQPRACFFDGGAVGDAVDVYDVIHLIFSWLRFVSNVFYEFYTKYLTWVGGGSIFKKLMHLSDFWQNRTKVGDAKLRVVF
jgi:hypothetical protein